jgi:signal transduction histidine kinase
MDEGPGLSTPVLRRMFEPFFTARPGGTGLGLSTAWEIVQRHGGTIDASNMAGGGARLSVWLPGRQSQPQR